MILIGECKKDFLEVYGVDEEDKSESEQYFNDRTEVERHALIAEWFLTKGYIVDVVPVYDGSKGSSLTTVSWMPNPTKLPIDENSPDYDFKYDKNRNVATEITIRTLCEVYNKEKETSNLF